MRHNFDRKALHPAHSIRILLLVLISLYLHQNLVVFVRAIRNELPQFFRRLLFFYLLELAGRSAPHNRVPQLARELHQHLPGRVLDECRKHVGRHDRGVDLTAVLTPPKRLTDLHHFLPAVGAAEINYILIVENVFDVTRDHEKFVDRKVPIPGEIHSMFWLKFCPILKKLLYQPKVILFGLFKMFILLSRSIQLIL